MVHWDSGTQPNVLHQSTAALDVLHCFHPSAGGCGRMLPVEFRLLRAPRVFSLQVGCAVALMCCAVMRCAVLCCAVMCCSVLGATTVLRCFTRSRLTCSCLKA